MGDNIYWSFFSLTSEVKRTFVRDGWHLHMARGPDNDKKHDRLSLSLSEWSRTVDSASERVLQVVLGGKMFF